MEGLVTAIVLLFKSVVWAMSGSPLGAGLFILLASTIVVHLLFRGEGADS